MQGKLMDYAASQFTSAHQKTVKKQKFKSPNGRKYISQSNL